MKIRRIGAVLLALAMLLPTVALAKTIVVDAADYEISKDGWYDGMEEVAIYLTFFDKLHRIGQEIDIVVLPDPVCAFHPLSAAIQVLHSFPPPSSGSEPPQYTT